MPNDFIFQAKYVKDQALRLITMQDDHPASPSYGCFHYAYWRDKTSEFPDTRFQEAGATLGLLSHPALFSSDMPCSRQLLRQRFSASLVGWKNQQHRDGSFDEWYKHEHGFAATAFSLIANSLAMHFLQDAATKADREIYEQVATGAANWLTRHEDLVKTNHEMAGAAALALAGHVLREENYSAAAASKHHLALACQTEEGWFNEIAGMDLGYCFVLLDYAMLYREFNRDDSGVPALQKLYDFVFPFLQPDLTISPEAGLCLNPYVSRLGTLLLSDVSEKAAFVTRAFLNQSPGYKGIAPYLSDDLRLCRWSHLPLVASLFLESRLPAMKKVTAGGEIRKVGLSVAKDANILSYRSDQLFGAFLPAGGGVMRAFFGAEDSVVVEDRGYIYWSPTGPLSTVGYDRARALKQTGEAAFSLELPFAPVVFFFPSFISRTVLRVLGTIPGAAVWLRRGIDFYRQKKKTAVNQSSAPVSSEKAVLRLSRTVSFDQEEVVIKDSLRSERGPIQLRNLTPFLCVGGEQWTADRIWSKAGLRPEAPGEAREYRIIKRFSGGAQDLQIELFLEAMDGAKTLPQS
jgi:hypothetical protein